MLNKIIFFSIKNKLIVGLFLLALIIYGSLQLTKLPIDAVPDITNNQVQVITVAPSFGATDIERLITFPIEQVNSNLPGLIEIRSFSRFGLSLVTIVFTDETDIYWARQQVSERLQKVKDLIPKGIGTPELAPVTTGLGEIYQYILRPEKGYESKYTVTELRTIQDWMVRRQLLGVKGVAEVSSFGGKLKQYEIAVDPNKLKSYRITINDVFNAVESNNQNTGGAYIEKGPTVLFIRTEGLYKTPDDVANTYVKRLENGSPLLIRDVAEVNIGHAVRYGAMCYNDQGEVAGAVVMMLKGENSSEVIVNVKQRIAQIQETLPEGVVIEPFLDRTKMVNNAITTVEKNLLEGALIVIFILVLFLGNLRAGLLVASVIPLSMLFAVIMMNLFGVSGNLMSLGALDFGLIVDGAVIIVESVMHQLSSRNLIGGGMLKKEEMDEEVNRSASKMMNSAVFGQVIILIVYLPILSLQGIEGKMFKPMAQTVAFALLGAFILSLTYIPMMSALVLSRKTGHQKNLSDRLMGFTENLFTKALTRALSMRKKIFALVLLLFAVSVYLLTTLGGEFIPALEEGDFAVETRLLTGSGLQASVENTQKAAGLLKKHFPEVQKVVTKIGSGEVPTDPMPMEAADMIVVLSDKSEWTTARTFNELAERMSEKLSEVPGLTYSFQFPVQMRFNELMTGAKQDVVCKIFGEDLDTLATYAEKMGSIISGIEGARDLYVEAVSGMPQLIITYKRDALALYGVDIADVNRVINAAFAGVSAGMMYEGERRFDLTIRLKGDIREKISSVKEMLIPTPGGDQVPLDLLADVETREGPNQIQREDAKRRIIVGFNVRGRDVQSIVNELQKKVSAQIKFPAGYYPTYGGAFENLNEAKKRLSVAVPVSLVLIFMLLYFAFHSVRLGLLIYSAIPLSAIGGILALYFRGMPFSISAGVGFIALFGVAVLNGIVLISEFKRLRENGEDDLREVVLTGTRLRLRPVLMTAFVASLGFLPMALSNGAGAEVQRPLASVVIGGLLVATFLTLFVLPMLYMFVEGRAGSGMKAGKSAVMILLIAMLLIPTGKSKAQRAIVLNEAIEIAFKNNLSLKNEKLKAEYQRKSVGSAVDIPFTAVSAEYGQINSTYTDNRLTIGQTMSFPAVYAQQRNILKQDFNTAVLSVALKEREVKLLVSQIFLRYQVLKAKSELLRTGDSLFGDFLKKAELRLKAGESNLLERSTADNQLAQIKLQHEWLKVELGNCLLEFKLALNTAEEVFPDVKEKLPEPLLMADTSAVAIHPSLKISELQKQVSKSKLKLERSRFLPDLSLSYSNMSMKGVGADNVLYDRSARFQSAQLGLGIPLFFGSRKSMVNSAKVGVAMAETLYADTYRQLKRDYMKAVSEYEHWREAVKYYESSGLRNYETIRQTASLQYAKGEISYMEWVLLNHQAIAIMNDYINAKESLGKSILTINYLSEK